MSSGVVAGAYSTTYSPYREWNGLPHICRPEKGISAKSANNVKKEIELEDKETKDKKYKEEQAQSAERSANFWKRIKRFFGFIATAWLRLLFFTIALLIIGKQGKEKQLGSKDLLMVIVIWILAFKIFVIDYYPTDDIIIKKLNNVPVE